MSYFDEEIFLNHFNHLKSQNVFDINNKNKSIDRCLIIAGVDEVGRGPLAGPVVAATVAFVIENSANVHDDVVVDNISFDLGQRLRKCFAFMKELGITDSKKLTAIKRKSILEKIGIVGIDKIVKNHVYKIPSFALDSSRSLSNSNSNSNSNSDNIFVYFSLAEISVEDIDRINILRASITAMNYSFANIVNSLDLELLDGKNCNRYASSRSRGCPVSALLLIDGNNKINSLNFISKGIVEISEIPIVKGDQKSLIIALASIIAKEYRDNLMLELSKIYPGYSLEKHAGYPTKQHKELIKKLGPASCHRKTFKGVKEFI